MFGVDEPLYLSTHCPPAALAPPGHAVVHVMRYHHRDEPLDAFAQRAHLRRAARQAGIDDADVVEERFLAADDGDGRDAARRRRWARRPPAGDDGRAGPALLLAGDWVGDVGLLSDAAVASGRRRA